MAARHPIFDLTHCRLCPHRCGADRVAGRMGACRLDAGLHIAKICLHKGEEPLEGTENGVCNVFFSGCNLSCMYCQNYQISQSETTVANEITDYDEAVESIDRILAGGVKCLGFVSPTSHIPHMLAIIDRLHARGLFPKIIYNTNAYESVETLRQLAAETHIDVFLPDYKYAYNDLGKAFSGVADYAEVSLAAIAEMCRQKSAELVGGVPAVVVRHLVLPNHVANSFEVLETLAQTCGTDVWVSLMSQYYPVHKAVHCTDLNRTVQQVEYDMVLDALHRQGFDKGWVQQLESSNHLQPDFANDNPFEP